ncbi:MAG0770 family lipoprotein [Mycoplasmopsis primatum]|uniref:MAG0770 family lipoprotein n=1 Tax=Mycoplasmopsis primatum TaxID=55604 RepID=UPI0004978613|nr:hypothetical protein [Mycoplasmopsis primatum]
MFSKKNNKFLYLSITPIPFALVSCQSSFYKQKSIIEAEFNKELTFEYNQYKSLWNKFLKAINDKNEYQKYYYDNYQKINKITKKWFDLVIKKISIYTDSYNDGQSLYELKLGYFPDPDKQSFVELTENEYYKNKKIDVFNELTNAPKNNIANARLNMSYVRILNDELDSIIKDWIYQLNTNSAFKLFVNHFNTYEGWPFFKNVSSNLRADYQGIFFESLKKDAESMSAEYVRRYYDAKKINIDYSKIKGNPENNFGHTHALVNLWNEWNTIAVPKYEENSSNKTINWSNNKIKETINFVQKLYKTSEILKTNKNKKLILRFTEKKNLANIIDFDFHELFDEFIFEAVDNISDWNMKIHPSDLDPNQFKSLFKDTLQDLLDIANKISRIINTYKN